MFSSIAKGIDIRPEGASCESCTLSSCAFVPGSGPARADLVVVGEAPGNQEVVAGEPFVGRAGRLLNDALQEVGIDRAAVAILNAVCCRPWPHRSPTPKEIRACRPRLILEIVERKPKAVLALGSVALRSLLPGRTSIEKAHGHYFPSEELGCHVVPAVHPAAILRSPNKYRFADLVGAVKVAASKARGVEPASTVPPLKLFVYDSYDEMFDSEDFFGDGSLLGDWYDLVRLTPDRIPIAVDVENASDAKLLCVGVHTGSGSHVLTEEALKDSRVIEWLSGALTDPQAIVLGHNLKYDTQVLMRHGIRSKIDADTMLMSYVLDERPGIHALEKVCGRALKVPNWKAATEKYKKQMEKCPKDLLHEYNGKDVHHTYHLYPRLDEQLGPDERKVLDDLLIPGANVLAKMEYIGILVDKNELQNLDKQLLEEIEDTEGAMFAVAGRKFNPNSPKQLLKLLYEDLELPVPGTLSTDKEHLEIIAPYHPLPKLLLQWRKAKKLHGTYVKGIQEMIGRPSSDGRIHTSFNLFGTVTGRLSSSSPNLQNIPSIEKDGGRCRNLFIATPGHTLVEFDLSQAEVRVLGYYSQDKQLISALEAGGDIHTRTASIMFKKKPEEVTKALRKVAKHITFGLIYGMGLESLAEELDVSIEEAEELVKTFFSAFPRAKEWIEETETELLAKGALVTPFGRRRRFDIGLFDGWGRAKALRQGPNFMIQSLASDLNLLAMIKIGDMIDWESTRLLLSVHDSLLLETKDDVDEVAKMVKKTMQETPPWFNVPMVADGSVGTRWGSLKKWEGAA